MIKEVFINGLLFQVQHTYSIYASEEDRSKGRFIRTSDREKFKQNVELARAKEKAGDQDNKFIVL